MARYVGLAGRALALLLVAWWAPAQADPAGVVNALRTAGCSGQPGVGARVQPNNELDAVARELARGTVLRNALARIGYPAQSSASFHVNGARDDATIKRMLAERFCATLNDVRYTELGVFQGRAETWIVLAARAAPPPVLEPVAVEQRVLELVNEARATARTCGQQELASAGPLALSVPLISAALLHAEDMAKRGELTHSGSDGSDSGERITRAGYVWRAAGENVAAGQWSAEAVVAAWLGSSGHCATLMGPQFNDMGIGFVLAYGRNPGIYWVQTFGAPR